MRVVQCPYYLTQNSMLKKIDYAIAGLIGFFAGIFAIPVLYNIHYLSVSRLFSSVIDLRNPFILLSLPWILAVCALIGIAVMGLLGRKYPFFIQFGKFAVVGVLNTAIDFGILNIISLMTGVTGGLVIGGVNIPGVALALTNAYFWNKFWVFSHRDNKGAFHDLPTFLLVSGVGVLGNSGIVIFATLYPPMVAVSAGLWLNIAKLCATVFSLVWNFLGYKFIVFKSSESIPEEMPRTPIAPL